MAQLDRHRFLATLALLIAVGSALWMFEELLPRPLPWVQPGLANIVTMLAIAVLGRWYGIPVALGRVFLGALLLGRLGSAGFFMSLSGGLCSAIVMGALWQSKIPLSVYGIGISGALIHGLAQLVVAMLLVYTPFAFQYLLPFITIPAALTGVLVGFLTSVLLRRRVFAIAFSAVDIRNSLQKHDG